MQWPCGFFPITPKASVSLESCIYFTTSVIQSSMNMTLVAEAILNLNSNQFPWFHAPTSLYKVTNGHCEI